MSKQVKQMQMESLSNSFEGVKDMVFLTVAKVDAKTDNTVRLGLRKKNIHLMMVKNSLLRRVFRGTGIEVSDKAWEGPTVVAWGGDSVKGLSKEVEAVLLKDPKFKDKVSVKSVVAEGVPVSFEKALAMPTRKEAIGDIVGLLLSGGGSIAGALTGPASQLASQIQTIADKAPEDSGAPAA